MRVESSPRRRGRTPKGPLPTCVMLATLASASPVETGLACSIAAAGQRFDVQRNLPDLAVTARGRHAHVGGQAAQIELHGHLDGLVRQLCDNRPGRFSEAAPGHDQQKAPGARGGERIATIGVGLGFCFLPGGRAQHHARARERCTGSVGHDAADRGGQEGSRPQDQGGDE